MEMIIGGAFQGKSTYAKEHHPDICWKNGADLEKEELMNAKGVLGSSGKSLYGSCIKKQKGNTCSMWNWDGDQKCLNLFWFVMGKPREIS